MESTIFRSCRPPETQEYVRKFLVQRKYDEGARRRARDRYVAACNAVMRLESESTLIRPIVQGLDNADFTVDLSPHSRYMTLFAGYGVRDFDTRRCSLLEYGGRPGRAKARRVLEEAKDQLQPTSHEYALLRTWEETFNDVCAVTLDAPPQFEALVWPAYKRAMCDPGYYLSLIHISEPTRRYAI